MDLSFTKNSLSKAITAFAVDLYKEVNKNGTCKNIFFSPMSISTALGMVLLGAKGRSKTQMEKALHLEKIVRGTKPPASQRTMPDVGSEDEVEVESAPPVRCLEEGEISSEFKNLLFQLNNLNDGYQLSLANNLFIRKGFEFLQQYLICTKEIYGAILQIVDFYNATEEARQKINLMVENETQGKIKELLAPGLLDTSTVLVLTNAVYFKATWQHQFNPKYTVEGTFRMNENESKPVHMMYQKGTFKWGCPVENAQVLCLPYIGEVLSMIILLPDDISDLEKVEQAMTCENLAHWTASENTEEHNVEMYIPRFKLEDTLPLNSTLQELGMSDVFGSKANLSGISLSSPLYLSTVIHKAYVEVNEVGTEAAAATGAVVSTRSLKHYELFQADHSFLFCIRHNPTDTILFLGKLCSPS